jgi:hypothetical protein
MLHAKFYQLRLNKKEKMLKKEFAAHKEVNTTNHKQI